jgi:hypothetical protein
MTHLFHHPWFDYSGIAGDQVSNVNLLMMSHRHILPRLVFRKANKSH